jgi:hypothetical protein
MHVNGELLRFDHSCQPDSGLCHDGQAACPVSSYPYTPTPRISSNRLDMGAETCLPGSIRIVELKLPLGNIGGITEPCQETAYPTQSPRCNCNQGREPGSKLMWESGRYHWYASGPDVLCHEQKMGAIVWCASIALCSKVLHRPQRTTNSDAMGSFISMICMRAF